MNFRIIALISTVFISQCFGQVQITTESPLNQSKILTKDNRSVNAELQSFEALVTDHNRFDHSQLDVIMLRDPDNGIFWWHYLLGEPGQSGEVQRFLTGSVFYEVTGKIVCFTYRSRSLWFGESAARYASMTDAQSHVVQILAKNAGELASGRLASFHRIDLGRDLPFTFYEQDGNSNPMIQPTLRQVARFDQQWRVLLDGPNGDSAVVLLDNDYKVISASIVSREKAH